MDYFYNAFMYFFELENFSFMDFHWKKKKNDVRI